MNTILLNPPFEQNMDHTTTQIIIVIIVEEMVLNLLFILIYFVILHPYINDGQNEKKFTATHVADLQQYSSTKFK